MLPYFLKNTNSETCAYRLLLLKDKRELPCTFCFLEEHTCGYGLIGRDASHGDSVSRSLVREASSEGSLPETVNEMIMLQVNDALGTTSLCGESGKG